MKKLIIAAAIVCAVETTRAASVVWGGAVAVPGDINTALPAGTQAALLYSSVAFTADAQNLSSWSMGATADNGGSVVSLYTFVSDDVINYAFSSTYSVDGSVDGYYAVLVLNGTSDKASYYDIGQITGTSGSSSPTVLTVNSLWTSSGNEYLTQGGYTVNVPEPTSGLLLLLGMAGLALKRKRA